MSEFAEFSSVAGRGFYRPVGTTTFEAAIELIAAGIVHARELGLEQVLVDARGLTGFDPPNSFQQYFKMKRWMEAAGGQVQIALVMRPEMLDPQKFGTRVAENRGFLADSFLSEEEALAWLDGR